MHCADSAVDPTAFATQQVVIEYVEMTIQKHHSEGLIVADGYWKCFVAQSIILLHVDIVLQLLMPN